MQKPNCWFKFFNYIFKLKSWLNNNPAFFRFARGKLPIYTLKMLGCFNPNLSQIWTNPNVGLKMQ